MDKISSFYNAIFSFRKAQEAEEKKFIKEKCLDKERSRRAINALDDDYLSTQIEKSTKNWFVTMAFEHVADAFVERIMRDIKKDKRTTRISVCGGPESLINKHEHYFHGFISDDDKATFKGLNEHKEVAKNIVLTLLEANKDESFRNMFNNITIQVGPSYYYYNFSKRKVRRVSKRDDLPVYR